MGRSQRDAWLLCVSFLTENRISMADLVLNFYFGNQEGQPHFYLFVTKIRLQYPVVHLLINVNRTHQRQIS